LFQLSNFINPKTKNLMATETGHAKNIANFENLISFVSGYGVQYNPSNANISLSALQALRTSAQSSLDGLYNGTTIYINAVNARQTSFEDLKKLATRCVSALEASGAKANIIADAVTINRKIQGTRAGKIVKVETGSDPVDPRPDDGTGNPDPRDPSTTTSTAGNVPTNISVSQQSFDSLIEHFARLIALLAAEPLYTPNEPELSVARLNNKLTAMRNSNTAAINSYTTVSNNRITRNQVLYGETSGLCDIAAQVKSYVKSLYGATSPNYKQISKISFKKQGK